MLNYIVVLFIFLAIMYSLFSGNASEVSSAAINSSADAVGLVIQLAGAMGLWGGIMAVAEKSGLTGKVNRLMGYILHPFFKTLDKHGKAMEAVAMNVTANLLGIGNAATPLGIKAMREILKEEKTAYTTICVAMLVLLNTASIQLLPVTIGALRSKYGAAAPFDCTLPILANSLISLIFGMAAVYLLFGRKNVLKYPRAKILQRSS